MEMIRADVCCPFFVWRLITIEIWKDIKGYEGYYKVSNLGNVKSLSRMVIRSNGYPLKVNERILKVNTNRFGYNKVKLNKDGKTKNCFVHRLVATSFIDNPSDLPEVNHKNEIKNDKNLEWISRIDNVNYGSRTAKAIENSLKTKRENGYFEILSKRTTEYNKTKKIYKYGGEHHNAKKVECDGITFGSIVDCAKYFNVKCKNISCWLQNEDKMPKEFKDMNLRYA